jgi:hypothetical protein
MLDPKEQAKFDQSAAALAEVLPSAWKQLYDGLMKEGFTEEQTMRLLSVWIFANFSRGVLPP